VRILYLTPGCFDKGGISRYNRYQITALRELFGPESVDVYSVLGPDKDSFEEPFATRGYVAGLSPGKKASYIAQVASSVLLRRPDVIVAAHVNLSGLAALLAAPARAAVIMNAYGSEVWSGFRLDSAWGLRRAHHVIADCHFTGSYLEERGLRPRRSVAVVWDCVDLERFTPGRPDPAVLAKYGIPDPSTGVNLLTLGRMAPQAAHKGYERLLEAFARAAARVPALRLIYAGRGGLVPVLRERAARLGLGERVFFTEAVHERDLADVYRSAHLFSLISDRGVGRGEGIPLTPLEAAACGVLILVGNQDGSQEAVVEGENGHILDPFDIGAQAATIERLALDAGGRARMCQRARERVVREFGFEVFREKHRRFLSAWIPGAAAASAPAPVEVQRP
jgi:phosphatidyl-myo-inositol dimannoside synthase